MNKYVGINAISIIIANIKQKFAERQHIHEISDVNGLQRKIDELTPPPDIETSEDVIIAFNRLSLTVNDLTDTVENLNSDIINLNNTIDTLIPAIGEIYITISEENPSLRFGGTWEQIKDTFLLASGDIYDAGAIGGEAAHTLTIEEMPSHSHTFQRHMLNNDDNGTNTGQSGYGVTNKTIDIYETTTGSTGGGQAHNNMPPYLAVYVWKRVA